MAQLPTFVLMQPYNERFSFYNYGGPRGSVPHSVLKDSEKGVFNPLVKIEVEQAKIDSSYVHLKFTHTRKYFAVVGGVVVANSDKGSVFHIEQRLDGYVRIKSGYFEKYWRLSPSWIWADEDREGRSYRLDDVFWPCKVNETTIALRSAANNRYCARLSDTDGKKNCLNAAVTTKDKQARLEVEELVSGRKIISVVYHMDEAKIIDEKPFAAGKVMVENKGDRDASMAAEITYEDEKSVNFSHGFSVTAGATATLKASVPLNVDGSIQVHAEATKSFQWGHASTTKQTLKATGSVTVAGRHTALVHYVGTKGTCNIPFSYTQVDTSSVDEKITRKTYHDGVFTGSNSYSFHFVVDKAIPMK